MLRSQNIHCDIDTLLAIEQAKNRGNGAMGIACFVFSLYCTSKPIGCIKPGAVRITPVTVSLSMLTDARLITSVTVY